MATISEKIKQALADIELVRKDLSGVDEDIAQLKAVRPVLEATQQELEETRACVEAVKAERAKYEDDFQRWREVCAREQAKGNATVDQLQQRLELLNAQVKEREAEHQSILDGIAALHQRLRVG